MAKRTRWQPPYPDPAKVVEPKAPALLVFDTPVSERRLRPEKFEPPRSGWGPKCLWPECDEYPDPLYKVHLCTEHAETVRNEVNGYDDYFIRTVEARRAETAQRKARTAEKIDAGLRPGGGDLIPGWVYYIELDGLIKIGYSTDVTKRMKAYAPTAKLLAAEPGTKKVERSRHQHFGAYLARGREWFQDVPELREWIDTVVAEYGGAGHLAYHWGGRAKPDVVGTKRMNRRW